MLSTLYILFEITVIYCFVGDNPFELFFFRIGEARSLLHSSVNIMALKATASKQLRRDMSKIIGMRNELVVARLPSRQTSRIQLCVSQYLKKHLNLLLKSYIEKAPSIQELLFTVEHVMTVPPCTFISKIFLVPNLHILWGHLTCRDFISLTCI